MSNTHAAVLPNTQRRWCVRSVFLSRRQPFYTFNDAARRLGLSRRLLRERVESLTYDSDRGPDGAYRFTWVQLVWIALDRWTLAEVFDALGADAAKVMPELLRPQAFTINLPDYLIQAVMALARRAGTDADAFLADHLLDIVSSNAAELEGEIPGLRAALDFPETEV